MASAIVLASLRAVFKVQSLFMGTFLHPILEQWQANHHWLYLGALASLVIIGFYLLCKGGEWLTDSASDLAKTLGASPVVIGLTVVSMATSAPELFTCLTAVLKGSSALVAGNLVGSNLANVGLVLGFALILRPLKSENSLPAWQLPFLMGVSVCFAVLCMMPIDHSEFSHLDGCLGIMAMLAFLYFLKKDAGNARATSKQEGASSAGKCLLLLGVSSIMLWLGSESLVEGSIGLAREAGVSDAIIGLTLVAIGTSLPELAASYRLALRYEHAILLGNVVGSNIFNILFVGGITGMILPFSIPSEMFEIEFPAMLLITAVLWVLLASKAKLRKPHGILLLTIYFAAIICATLMHA